MNDPLFRPPLTPQQVEQYHQDGYLFIEHLLNEEEIQLLRTTVRDDFVIQNAGMDVRDTQGRRTNLSLWNHPGDDIYGAIARCRRIVDAMEQLLGSEVYHYHSKLSAKEPHVGGAWEWHQDYGYWYQNGCLFPDMASVFIAIDACTQENGCLEVLQGSHRMGRIEHGRFGDQTGADPERVEHAARVLKKVLCEMAPGAGLYFHCNLLHCSAPNLSHDPRWGLLCCYNLAANNPFKEHHHPQYTPLQKLPDSAILATGAKASQPSQEFLRQENDQTSG